MARDWREIERLIQPYLLDTAPARDRARVDHWLGESAECRAAIEAERQRLAVLDLLPDAPAPEGLAARTLRAVEAQDQLAPAEGPGRRVFTALQGLIAVAVVICVAAILLPAQQRWHQQVLQEAVERDLQVIGVALKQYASEAKSERYPPLSPYEGVWAPDLSLLYPRYIQAPEDLVNSALPNARELKQEMRVLLARPNPDWQRAAEIFAVGFTYTGYAIRDEEMLERWRVARAESGLQQRDDDVQAEGETVYRIREGIERFFITDINNPAATTTAQSEIPILFARTQKGTQAIFMDGHVAPVEEGFFLEETDN
jgi:type II secretory pathway pseudopilin PulG